MARQENPPFQRGETYFGDGTPNTTDGANLIGKEWIFEDVGEGTVSANTGGYVRCRVVRNTSGISLLPKRIGRLSTTAGEFGVAIDGYVATTREKGYPIDEYLPSGGVQDDDLFYVVVEGPCTVLTSLAGDADNVLAIGQYVYGQTAATSGATTAGRAGFAATSGATTPLFESAANRLGRAMSAVTTANTNSDLRLWVGQV